MGTCGQPGYVFRDFCLKQGIEFIIFCVNQGIDLSIFILNVFSWTINSKIFTSSMFGLNVLIKQGIKYQNSVLNRVGKSAIFVLNRVRVWGAAPHLPTQGYIKYPPPPGNLRRNLCWVAKRRPRKVPRKYTSVANKNISKQTILYFIGVTWLVLTWIGWPNGEKLASTCVQIWSQPKWAQVIASQRKCTQVLAKRSRK